MPCMLVGLYLIGMQRTSLRLRHDNYNFCATMVLNYDNFLPIFNGMANGLTIKKFKIM